MRILFIINLGSGGEKASELLRRLQSYIKIHNAEKIQVEELNTVNCSEQLAHAFHYDTVVIGGGDGTMSHMLPKLSNHKRVGIIPLGTGNDLAKELGIFNAFNLNNPEEIISFFQSQDVRAIAIGSFDFGEDFKETISFLNYVSFGFDAKVVNNFDSSRKNFKYKFLKGVLVNQVTYFLSALKNLNYFNSLGIQIRKDQEQAIKLGRHRSLIFTNIQSIMGIAKSNLSSSPFDQKIECILVNSIFLYLKMILTKYSKFFTLKILESAEVWEISNLPEDLYIQIDGEPFTSKNSLNYRISIKDYVNVIC